MQPRDPHRHGGEVAPQDRATDVTLTGDDIDGDSLTFVVTSLPAHGVLTGTSPDLQYTPDDGYLGSDEFTFETDDGIVSSPQGTVSIDVVEGNSPPTATSASYTVPEDDSAAIILTGTDPDGDPLVASVVQAPAHGSLDEAALPTVVYTPDPDFHGADSFSFVVSDDEFTSAEGFVSVDVVSQPDPPEVLSVIIGPNDAGTNDVLVAVADVTDVDGDTSLTVSYEWFVGAPSVGETGDSLDGAVYFDKGDVVYAVATANDGGLDSAPKASNLVTIGNSSPSGQSAALAPVTPVTGDELVCRLGQEAVDPDGEDVSYVFAWTVDGEPFGEDTGLASIPTTTYLEADTIPGEATFAGQVWSCEVTATDLEDDGDVVTPASVTVEEPGVCGDGAVDAGEEIDPTPGPFVTAPGDAGTCRYDFGAVRQMSCGGACSIAGPIGCDQDDADMLCRLSTDNPASVALTWNGTTALAEPGFGCAALGLGTPVEVDRGVGGPVSYVDGDLLADHGAVDVVLAIECSD